MNGDLTTTEHSMQARPSAPAFPPSAEGDAREPSSFRPIALSLAVLLGVVAAILRVVPHPPNFSAVGSLGIFGGARLRAWQAYLMPLGIMILSDLILWVITGFDFKYSLGHLSRAFVYASFMLYVLIGRCIRKQVSFASIAIAATLGGLQFFVVTNFCEWLFQPLQPYYAEIPEFFRYARDGSGLMKCFAVALGFYQQETPVTPHPFMLFTDFRFALLWTVVGDVLFTSMFMLVHARLAKAASPIEQAPASVSNA